MPFMRCLFFFVKFQFHVYVIIWFPNIKSLLKQQINKFFGPFKGDQNLYLPNYSEKHDLGKNFKPKYSHSAEKIWLLFFFQRKTQHNRKWENFEDPPVGTAWFLQTVAPKLVLHIQLAYRRHIQANSNDRYSQVHWY